MIHDAIVVGSGPAGAVAAGKLAQQGKSVLLVDRQSFPRDKVCGDGMPASVMKLLIHDLGIDVGRVKHHRIAALNIVSPSGYSLTVEEKQDACYSMTSRRYDFDAVLHQWAVQRGAKFEVMHVERPLLSEDQQQVIGVVERRGKQLIEHEAKVVIGADGAASAVARGVRGQVSDTHDTAIAIRAYGSIKKPLPHCVYFNYKLNIVPGYGWIFPVGEDRVNVGLGLFDQAMYRERSESLKAMLEQFLYEIASSFPVELEASTVKSWPIPCWTAPESRVLKGAYLTGDAGRFADALTGGGIYPAMITGLLAGEAATHVLEGKEAREAALEFDRRCNLEINRDLRRALWVQRHVTSRPPVFNGLLAFASTLPVLKKPLLHALSGQHVS